MIEEIKTKYNQLHHKMKFVQHMADVLDMNPHSVKNFHLGGFWSIPEDKQPKYVEELDKVLEAQNHV